MVRPEELSALLARVDRVVVRASRDADACVLYATQAAADIAELASALRVAPSEQSFFCMCAGTETLRLYRGQEELAVISNHHGSSVRCSLWTDSDARLEDKDAFARWFEGRGISAAHVEKEESERLAQKRARSFARWLEGMPAVLRPLWEGNRVGPGSAQQRALLLEAFPAARQRVQALFSWFGSGEGPWSGFPFYEGSVGALLMEYPTAELVAAAQGEELTDTQLEGAARLFAGWIFGRRRGDDLKSLPATLKARLLAHIMRSENQDKVKRARAAFG